MVTEYSTRRTTSRWPLALFLNALDAGALNTYAIWTEKNWGQMSMSKARQRMFLLECGTELALPQTKIRVDNPTYLYKDILQCIRLLVPVQEMKKLRGNKVQGCRNVCPGNRHRKIRTICDNRGNLAVKITPVNTVPKLHSC
jgi:hypothetical protein